MCTVYSYNSRGNIDDKPNWKHQNKRKDLIYVFLYYLCFFFGSHSGPATEWNDTVEIPRVHLLTTLRDFFFFFVFEYEKIHTFCIIYVRICWTRCSFKIYNIYILLSGACFCWRSCFLIYFDEHISSVSRRMKKKSHTSISPTMTFLRTNTLINMHFLLYRLYKNEKSA